MSKILVVVPSRERPKQFLQMIKSLRNTESQDIDVSLILDSCDPMLDEYLDTCVEDVTEYLIFDRDTVTNHINNVYKRNKGRYLYYHLTNDDVIYRTQCWDEIFINRLKEFYRGVAFAEDGFQDGNLPTFPFINAEIVDSLGWLQQPTLNRYFGDTVWGVLADHETALVKCNNVLIEHLTPLRALSKEQIDVNLKANKQYQEDRKAYINWFIKQRPIDIIKFRRGVNKPKVYQSNPSLTEAERLKTEEITTGEVSD